MLVASCACLLFARTRPRIRRGLPRIPLLGYPIFYYYKSSNLDVTQRAPFLLRHVFTSYLEKYTYPINCFKISSWSNETIYQALASQFTFRIALEHLHSYCHQFLPFTVA